VVGPSDTFYVGNGLTSRMYSVSMSARRRRAAWRYDRLGNQFGGDAPNWIIRTDDLRIEQHLGPELIPAIQEAEQTARHFRAGARLSYDPRHEKVIYEDDSGEVPCAHDFRVHLELVRRVVDISDLFEEDGRAVAVAEPRTRVWLSVAEPPTWVYALLLPGCIAALVGVEISSSWLVSLLPLTIAAPYVWRVRIGRR